MSNENKSVPTILDGSDKTQTYAQVVNAINKTDDTSALLRTVNTLGRYVFDGAISVDVRYLPENDTDWWVTKVRSEDGEETKLCSAVKLNDALRLLIAALIVSTETKVNEGVELLNDIRTKE